MKTARHLIHWLLLLAIVCAFAPGVAPAAAQDDANAEGVAPYRAQVRLERSVFGPERGVLVHDADAIAIAPAQVDLRNFYARVRVTVPYDAAEQPWDAGFSFRAGRDAGWRVVVNSEGRWFAGLGGNVVVAEGELDALNLELGEDNEIELVADGDVAYLAVNREEIGSFDLTRRHVSGDVAVGATFSDSTINIGAEMEYSRFQIWELPAGEPRPIPAAAAALMEEGRDRADLDEPLGGPLDGELTETTESISVDFLGVETADFYARAEVTNPRDGTEQPFDIGLGFRDTGDDNQFRLVIAADGSWYFRYGVDAVLAAEEFAGFDPAAGASNLLELAVRGELGVLAVNGDLAGSFELSGFTGAGDIAIGAGFYPLQDVVEGDVTAYVGFAAWALDDAPVRPTTTAATPRVTGEPAETVTPEPTAGAETPEAVNGENAFRDAVDSTRSLPIAFGPADGELALEEESLALAGSGVDLRNFIVRVQLVNPYAAAEGIWDYGILFRLGEEEGHYRLIIVSTGEWFLSVGPTEPIQSGTLENLRAGSGEGNTLTLVVDGDAGSFGVNGAYVATLDLSAVSQSGDVAVGSSFFQGNFLDGAVTGYQDLVIWELPAGDAPGPAPTPEPGILVEPTTVPEPGATPRVDAGDSVYESPAHGYTVRYDDAWEIVDESSEAGVDYVRFSNGVSSIDFQSFASDLTPRACVDDEFVYYQTGEGFSDAQIALDVDDRAMQGDFEDGAWSVFWFTFTSDGEITEYTSYVECRQIAEGVLLRIVQFVPFEQYNDEIAARVDLLEGFSVEGEGHVIQTTPEPEATPGPGVETPGAAGDDSAVVRIEERGGSGIDGLATIDADGERSRVRVLLLGADEGAIALIQEGACTDLSGEPAFLLSAVEAGLSETTVPAPVRDLLDGGYVITIHVNLEDLRDPAACGPIAHG